MTRQLTSLALSDLEAKEEAARLRAKATTQEASAEESFRRCDTDGFLSQWASGISARENRAKAAVLEHGGRGYVRVLVDESGAMAPARVIKTRYGAKIAIFATAEAAFASRSGKVEKWIEMGARSMAKAGLRWGAALTEVEAKMWAPPGARGLSGASQVQVITESKCGRFSFVGWDADDCRETDFNEDGQRVTTAVLPIVEFVA